MAHVKVFQTFVDRIGHDDWLVTDSGANKSSGQSLWLNYPGYENRCAGMFYQRTECSTIRYQELVESVSSMSLMACAQASIPGTCGLTHHPTTPAASLATPHEPLGSFGLITIDGTPAIARFSI